MRKNLVVRGRIAPQFIRRACGIDPAGVVANKQVPRDDESIARVVSLAAQNDDRPADAEPLQHIDAPATGVFHEHEARHAIFFDRPAIDLAALLAVK